MDSKSKKAMQELPSPTVQELGSSTSTLNLEALPGIVYIEESPQEPPSGFISSIMAHLNATVDGRHTDLIVLATCFTTGLVDTVMFNAYGTFVSMQTGNTIFVALGQSDQSTAHDSWLSSLISIICFAIGALFFSRLNSLFLPPAQRRGTVMLSFLLQAVFILSAAVVIQTEVVNGSVVAHKISNTAPLDNLIPIALLSFQAAGQIVNSRAMGINEVPTVVITSLLCDLFSDQKLFTPIKANAKRNRRIVGFLLVLLGAIVSGWVSRETGRVEPVLWIAGGLKFAMYLAWTFWPWMQPRPEVIRNVVHV